MIGIAFKSKREALKVIRKLRKQGVKTELIFRGFEYIVRYQAK
jgi:hypothetical protein